MALEAIDSINSKRNKNIDPYSFIPTYYGSGETATNVKPLITRSELEHKKKTIHDHINAGFTGLKPLCTTPMDPSSTSRAGMDALGFHFKPASNSWNPELGEDAGLYRDYTPPQRMDFYV